MLAWISVAFYFLLLSIGTLASAFYWQSLTLMGDLAGFSKLSVAYQFARTMTNETDFSRLTCQRAHGDFNRDGGQCQKVFQGAVCVYFVKWLSSTPCYQFKASPAELWQLNFHCQGGRWYQAQVLNRALSKVPMTCPDVARRALVSLQAMPLAMPPSPP